MSKKKNKTPLAPDISWLPQQLYVSQPCEAIKTLTEEEAEQAHAVKEAIWDAVEALVDEMTDGLPKHVDVIIRMQLTESFRFWR